jgi:hypothetical protein
VIPSQHIKFAVFIAVSFIPVGTAVAQAAPLPPEVFGFEHKYKCPFDFDVLRLGDTKTPEACLKACEQHPGAAGCWWLDGTGGFPRSCRLCRTMAPKKNHFKNDWAQPMSIFIS